MKQSTFTKEFYENGVNGPFTGKVIARLNSGSKVVTGTHAVTHDDYSKTVSTHQVETYINGQKWKCSDETQSENEILRESDRLIKELKAELHKRANEQSEQTFSEKMTQLFS